jgi:hypothetical protein
VLEHLNNQITLATLEMLEDILATLDADGSLKAGLEAAALRLPPTPITRDSAVQ